MDGFAQSVVSRLVLGQALMAMLGFVMERSFLQEVFERSRGRAYEIRHKGRSKAGRRCPTPTDRPAE